MLEEEQEEVDVVNEKARFVARVHGKKRIYDHF
jgi:hypothetical protein